MAQHGTSHDIRQISGATNWITVNVGGGDQIFDPPLKGLYVGTVGNVRATNIDGDTETFVSMAAGIWHPMVIRIIHQSGTTALNMVGGRDI